MQRLDIYALILCMISVSGLCLCLRDAVLYLTAILIVKMASRGRGRRGRPRGTGQAPPTFGQPPVFDQQAFAEAVGVALLSHRLA